MFENERTNFKSIDRDLRKSRLNFKDIKPGFYLESQSAIYVSGPLPFWGSVVYISNEYIKGYNQETMLTLPAIRGHTFSNRFLIDKKECNSFYRIKNAKLARLLIDENTPEEFVKWFLRVSEGLKSTEPDCFPECEKWQKRELRV